MTSTRVKCHVCFHLGRTHDANFSLFREGEFASKGLQLFAEKGETVGLDAQPLAQAEGAAELDAYATSVLDEFNAPPITQGEGQSFAHLFVDSNHSMVSYRTLSSSCVEKQIPVRDYMSGTS